MCSNYISYLNKPPFYFLLVQININGYTGSAYEQI